MTRFLLKMNGEKTQDIQGKKKNLFIFLLHFAFFGCAGKFCIDQRKLKINKLGEIPETQKFEKKRFQIKQTKKERIEVSPEYQEEQERSR